MPDDKFSRSLTMRCSTCGGTQFECEAETGPYRCFGCDPSFAREEVLRENGLPIDNEVGEMATYAAKYARDELRKSMRKALLGSKHFKLK